MTALALVITDPRGGRFGHAARLDDALAGRSVLEHTLRRAAAIEGVARIVVVHPQAADVAPLLAGLKLDTPLSTHADPADLWDEHMPRVLSARKWALTAWRGGFGGATSYDELLPARPLVEALKAQKADAAVIVRADWCFFDPALASKQLKLHTDAPDAMKLTFTQAPPGLGAICTSRKVLEDLAEHHATFGNTLAYNPRKPVIDPIGREVCIPIPAPVRDAFARFIYDTPRAIHGMRAIAQTLGKDLPTADAQTITTALTQSPSTPVDGPRLPRFAFLELHPDRPVHGPITAQHHMPALREPMDTELACEVVRQLAAQGDTALIIGHLGDPLLHPDWRTVVQAAHDAGIFALGLETDLHCDDDTADQLAAAPLDAIAVRLNADTGPTYAKVMGTDAFLNVANTLKRLFSVRSQGAGGRDQQAQAVEPPPRYPWIIPKLVKVRDNVHELEGFFDRWMLHAGHAVIERFNTGGGLAEDLSPVPMTPPTPLSTPLDNQRLYVLSNGLATTDEQDWLGDRALGDARDTPLAELWHRAHEPAEA